MTGFKDLLQSERGAFCTLAVVAVTAMAALGKIDGAMWIDFMKWLAGILIVSKTVTTAVETHTTKQPQIPTARVVKE